MIARSLRLTVLIYFDLLFVRRISSFVTQFLMKTPRIADRKELWKYGIKQVLSPFFIFLKTYTPYRRSPLNFAEYGNLTLTLLKSLDVPTPSYVQVINLVLLYSYKREISSTSNLTLLLSFFVYALNQHFVFHNSRYSHNLN